MGRKGVEWEGKGRNEKERRGMRKNEKERKEWEGWGGMGRKGMEIGGMGVRAGGVKVFNKGEREGGREGIKY